MGLIRMNGATARRRRRLIAIVWRRVWVKEEIVCKELDFGSQIPRRQNYGSCITSGDHSSH
jgi:hypothetical protein